MTIKILLIVGMIAALLIVYAAGDTPNKISRIGHIDNQKVLVDENKQVKKF